VTLREEVTALLQALIRAETVNPPGNEIHAAEVLRDYFARNGIEIELYAREPERPNVVARLRGGDGPSLALLSHTDTVLADPREWERDPWSGDVVDDEIWGRGALDMKGQVAASAVALASLAREGFSPAGELVFLSVADEEVGAGWGLRWLVEEHPDAARCDFAINEGGGDRFVLGDTAFYACATAEKMSAPFVLRVRGRSGHGSMPGIADNALVKAARYIETLADYEPEPTLLPETRQLLEAVLGEVPPLDEVLLRTQAVHPLLPALVQPLLALTLSPTMVDASHKRNVIPGLCEVTVDCRLLPGQTPADAEGIVRAALGEGDYEIEFLEATGGTRSDLDTRLWDTLAEFTATIEPGAQLVPFACPGFTDSHFLREAYGTTAYGFFPLREMDSELAARLIHSADERIAIDDLELGTTMLRSAALSLLAA
jgi:acetylornithine deacetylase/succinyl-diaminopimelate desuccinylase-like protein